jgi:hypothetical protein
MSGYVPESRADLEPTSKQISLIFKLAAEREITERDEAMVKKTDLLSRRAASKLIDRMMKAPKTGTLYDGGRELRKYTPKLELGWYSTSSGDVLKISRSSRSGVHYGSVLSLKDDHYEWVYAGEAARAALMFDDVHPLTLEAAKTWGKMTGWCCICGTQMMEDASKQIGLHRDCAKQLMTLGG